MTPARDDNICVPCNIAMKFIHQRLREINKSIVTMETNIPSQKLNRQIEGKTPRPLNELDQAYR